MTDDPLKAAREKKREDEVLRAHDPEPLAELAFQVQRLIDECNCLLTARAQLGAVRLRGEPAYDAADLADAEQMVAMQLRGLRDRAVEVVARIAVGDGGSVNDVVEVGDRLSEHVDAVIAEIASEELDHLTENTEQGDTPP